MKLTEQPNTPFTDDLDNQIQMQKDLVEVYNYQVYELDAQITTLHDRMAVVGHKRLLALQELRRLNGIKAACES